MTDKKIVTLTQLNAVKSYVDEKSKNALRAVSYTSNTLNFFGTEDGSGEPRFSVDLPEEMVLDLTKTVFADNFVWSAADYPGSSDPHLDGQAVLVLAVKGDATVAYSFVSIANVISALEGEDTATASVYVLNNRISAAVNVSGVEGNALEIKTDGLFAPEVGVSAETGNTLVKKSDGFYVGVPDVSVSLSAAEGNILEQKEDGLYAQIDPNAGLTYATTADIEALFA